MTQRSATLVGFVAVLLWSLLALFTAASGAMPPFQLLAVSFGIGGLSLLIIRPRSIKAFRQPPVAWIVGIAGLFGYHFCYYFALRNAPPVEAGLINYLWPLLIVLFSAMLPGEKLRWNHLAGCALALAGAVLVVTRGQGFAFEADYALGYAAALVAALVWSSYSVLSRRLANVPSEAITGFCLATALLAVPCHLLLEQTVWPETIWQWAAIVALGLGPVGLAFYVWDIGVKKGDIQVLGAASYSAPLLSTLILILTGYAQYSHIVLLACLLITAGAVLAAGNLLFGRKRAEPLAPLMSEWNSAEDEKAFRDL